MPISPNRAGGYARQPIRPPATAGSRSRRCAYLFRRRQLASIGVCRRAKWDDPGKKGGARMNVRFMLGTLAVAMIGLAVPLVALASNPGGGG